MERIIFHIDVNSAYLSWTSVENLKTNSGIDLRDIPSVIGGDQAARRGVVLAKSGPAKVYEIKTGEPLVNAMRKCPNLVVAPPNHRLYSEYSKRMMDFLLEITSDLEKVSIDECYLDFTGIAHLYESPEAAAMWTRDEIHRRFGFTVNVGISVNKLLAKMASDFEKPNKVHTLYPEEIPSKLWPLPVEELFMAGKASVQTLNKLGIRTIGELASSDPAILSLHLKSHGRMLWNFANGIDDSPVAKERAEAKGIGNSTTLSKDAVTAPEAKQVLLALAESVSSRLQKSHYIAGSITVEIKYHTFVSVSHQMQLDTPLSSSSKIHQTACLLFDQLWNHEPIRLLGIRATKLMPDDTPIQMSLFDLETVNYTKQKQLDQALHSIKAKYGANAVVRGNMLKPPEN